MKTLPYLICFLLAFSVRAQQRFDNLESCLAYAYAHRQELQLFQLDQAAALEQTKQAKGALLPQVSGFSTLDNNVQLPVQLIPAELVGGNQGEFAEVQFGTQYNFSAGLEASIALWNSNLRNQLRQARLNEQKTTIQYQQQKQQITEAIANLYYLTILSQEIVAIMQVNQQNNDTSLQTAKAQYKAGTIELLALNRIQNVWLQGQQNLLQAKLNYQQQADRLKLALGISITGTIELPSFEALGTMEEQSLSLGLPITEYPTYKLYQLDREARDLDLKMQKQTRLPTVSAYARYTAQAQRNDFNFFNTGEPWFGIGVVGIRMDVPIFSGFQKKSAIQLAGLQQQMADKQIALFRQQQAQQDAALLQNYQSSQMQLNYAKKAYQLSQDNYEIAQFKYQNGVYTTEQLIMIYNELLTAQNQYLTQLGNSLMYRATIQVKNELSKEGE